MLVNDTSTPHYTPCTSSVALFAVDIMLHPRVAKGIESIDGKATITKFQSSVSWEGNTVTDHGDDDGDNVNCNNNFKRRCHSRQRNKMMMILLLVVVVMAQIETFVVAGSRAVWK